MALVSAAAYQHLDEDLPMLTDALARRGVESEIVDWHDDTVAWERFALAVIRSPWDYTWQLDAFLTWAERVSATTTLANPLPILRWNTHKRYLVELARAGAPVVATTVLEPGDAVTLVDAPELVVKPAVSAGGRDTGRYAADRFDEAHAHAERLLAEGRSVLVQPYLDRIDDASETSIVYAGDVYSHGFRKGPILAGESVFVEGLYREEDIGPREPSAAERAVAEEVLDALGACVPGCSRADLLYARVDVAPGPDGEPVLLELELTEPSLFLAHAPGAAERVAAEFAAALGRIA
jgi:glutathione synthase/RimK-type ligase-like ATP-grasp enzyme